MCGGVEQQVRLLEVEGDVSQADAPFLALQRPREGEEPRDLDPCGQGESCLYSTFESVLTGLVTCINIGSSELDVCELLGQRILSRHRCRRRWLLCLPQRCRGRVDKTQIRLISTTYPLERLRPLVHDLATIHYTLLNDTSSGLLQTTHYSLLTDSLGYTFH